MTDAMLIRIFLFVIGSEAIVNPRGPTVVSDYTNCLLQLMDVDFESPGLMTFANSKNVSSSVFNIRSELLKHVHSRGRYSVQIANPSSEVPICGQTDKYDVLHKFDKFKPIPLADYFIIAVDNYIDFTYLGTKLISSRSWNPHAKFIVLLLDFSANDKTNVERVENILTCLFKYNVINIVAVVPQANNIRKALIYGWKPYNPPEYCGYRHETARNRLILENVCKNGVINHNRGVFNDRVPLNMKGCVLSILALERQPFVSSDEDEPNIERKLVNEVLKTFNYEPKYEVLKLSRGERDTGEWDGAIRQLVSGTGNILLGGIFPDNDVHEDFECSSSYLADSYTWVVPRATHSAKWRALIVIFKRIVWMTAILTFIISGIVWKILGNLSGDAARNKSLIHCYLSTWICTLGFCTYLRPKKETLRVFFVFLNIYCMLYITGYQTKLIDVLRNPTFEYQISTVEELVLSGLKFGGFEELHDLFDNSSDPFDFQLGEKWIDVEDISQALIDVTVHRNFSLLCSRLELAHISATMPEFSDGFGNYKYHAFKMDVFSVPMEMVTMKGFAYMKEISQTLGIFKQIGINAATRLYFASSNMRRRAKMLRLIEGQQPDVNSLSLQHLQGGFLALMFGYIFGTLSLLIEITVNSKFVINKISKYKKTFKKS